MGSGGGDPHRVLGVPRDASEAEIRRAYRALAKRHHPDGGEGSVARFLAIQAAYEELQVGGGARPTPGPVTRPGPGWARRPRPPASAGPDPDAASSGAPRTGRRTGPSTGERRGPDPSKGRRAGGRRRATLGSTTYDEVEEAFEPGWGGASWYGPSSGTYWKLNPREYADPRKHGPEYQARARRPVATDRPPVGPASGGQPEHASKHPPGPTPPPAAPAGLSVVARILARWRRGRIRP